MVKYFNKLPLVLGMFLLVLSACNRGEHIDDIILPPAEVKVTNNVTSGTYFITSDPNTAWRIPLGFTTVSDRDRTINLTYTSTTGAAIGTHFNAPTSITIPAGKAVDTLLIRGIFANYTSTRIDTLLVTVSSPDAASAYTNSTYTVILRKYCDVVLNDFLGDYDNTNELWGTSAYGPYTTSISSVTPLSATKARIVVENIYDYGWGPITFELDWTSPTNFTATVIPQTSGIADAGTLSSTYAGQQVAVRPMAGSVGTFSSCEQTFTLRFQLGVAGVGYFANLYTVTMKR